MEGQGVVVSRDRIWRRESNLPHRSLHGMPCPKRVGREGDREGGMAVPVLAAQGGEREGWVSFPP